MTGIRHLVSLGCLIFALSAPWANCGRSTHKVKAGKMPFKVSGGNFGLSEEDGLLASLVDIKGDKRCDTSLT